VSPRRITAGLLCAAAALASSPAQAQEWVEEATAEPADLRPEAAPAEGVATDLVPPAPSEEPPQLAPPPSDDFESAARALTAGQPTTPRAGGPWTLDDGVTTEDVPWDDFDPRGDFYPRGGVHWGLELRAGAIPTTSLSTQERPQFELGGFVDLRYSSHSPWRMRIGLAVSAEPYRETNLGGGAFVSSSVTAIKLRVLPLSVDVGHNFGFLVGPEIGIQIAPGPIEPRVLFYSGGTLQLVGRTDDGRLEIGAYVSMVMTGVSRLERANFGVGTRRSEHFEIDAVLGVSGGYLF